MTTTKKTRSKRVAMRTQLEDEITPTRTSIKTLKMDLDTDEDSTELNSSPVKSSHTIPNLSFDDNIALRHGLSSSPLKKKKSVAFSDDLVSDMPSSPDPKQTPKKSILKQININNQFTPTDPNDTSLWTKSGSGTSNGPSIPEFWISGTILQLPPNSPNLPQLIEGCILVLKDPKFKKRFEVYATLNNLYKTNSTESRIRIFTISSKPVQSPTRSPSKSRSSPAPIPDSNYIIELSELIMRDIVNLEAEIFSHEEGKENNNCLPNKTDPFRIRIINQALKLITSIMLDTELNNFLPIDDAKWYYRHASTILPRPNVSKALISPYLVLIKDCKFNIKKKKLLLDSTDIPEKLLQCLLNMQGFPSSSMVTEKFNCFKNFMFNFPNIMAKNINHWFGLVVLNLCSLQGPSFTKCADAGTGCLVEVAKTFLHDRNVTLAVRQFLSSQLTNNLTSLISESQIEVDSELFDSQKDLAIDYVVLKLEDMIEMGQYRNAMDIWLAITLLVGDDVDTFDKWEHLNKWLKVPKFCFSNPELDAKLTSLKAWRAVIYNVCNYDLIDLKKTIEPIMRKYDIKDRQQAMTTALKQKVKLLTHLFFTIDTENHQDIVDVLHNLFLSILYTLLNPVSIKMHTKYLHVYWDKIVQPVLLNFYFKPSSSYANQLGISVLTRLLKNTSPINERNFSDVRCLRKDPVSVSEINSLPPRWVHSKFDRIMHNVIVIFRLEKFVIEEKINFINTFLGSIRYITKKEAKPSDATFDILENLPVVLDALFKNNRITFELAFKLTITLNDTFHPSCLIKRITDENREAKSYDIYSIIIASCLPNLTADELKEIVTLIISSINFKKTVIFMLDLLRLQGKHLDVENVVLSILNNRQLDKNDLDLALCGELCTIFERNFEPFVKRLIQSVVSISNAEELKRALDCINVPRWNLNVFKYFATLVHNAPNVTIQQFTLNCILSKFDNDEAFVSIVKFMAENNMDQELLLLKDDILNKSRDLNGFLLFEFLQVWKVYLSEKTKTTSDLAVMDSLLVSTLSNTSIDVKPFVTTTISKFPLLKQAFIENNMCVTEILVDQRSEDIPPQSPEIKELADTLEATTVDRAEVDLVFTETPIKEETAESETPVDSESVAAESVGNEVSVDVVPQDPVEVLELTIEEETKTKKTRKKRAKSKRKTTKKEKLQESVTSPSFDIHSFTAMLNAKLSGPPVKKSRRRKTESVESQEDDTSFVDEDPASVDDADVSSIIDSEAGTSMLETTVENEDEVSITREEADTILVEDDTASESPFLDYSQILQNGFLEQENSRKRVRPAEGPNKRPKLQDEELVEETFVSISEDLVDSNEKIEDSLESAGTDSDMGAKKAVDAKMPELNSSGETTTLTLGTFNSQNFRAHSTEINEVEDKEILNPYDMNASAKEPPMGLSETPAQRTCAAHVVTAKKNWVNEMQACMANMDDEELAQLDLHQQHALETQMMQLMLRIRTINQANK